MDPMNVAENYFDAWNRRDPSGIVAAFAEGGTYSDPSTEGRLTGQAIADHTAGLFSAFPDLHFEVVTAAPAGDGTVAAQWVMRGTNSGAILGLPPTGQTVALPGADFITTEGEKVRSVQGYFDRKTFVEQLGLQAIVQPYSMGPVSFGSSVHMSLGRKTRPGAFSLTVLAVRSEEEAQQTREYSRRILQEMAQMPGFISAMTARAGDRMFTTTAWEDPESPKQLLQGGAHREAMNAFFGPDFVAGGVTGVWVPDHLNASWIRCESCGAMVDYDKLQGRCRCGGDLPERLPYW